MKIKIQGGTVRHDAESLCVTCRCATIVQGPSLRDRIVECNQLPEPRARIPFPVVSCSGYSDRRQPSIYDMREAAWILRTDSKHQVNGFVRAVDLKPRERHRLYDDE